LSDRVKPDRESVLRQVTEQDIKFVRLWFVDILGNLKGFAIKVEDLQDALDQGVGFDGAAIEGFARYFENDMRAFPDPTTFVVLPWRPRENAVARMFCDIRVPQGTAFQGDPRYILKRNLRRLEELELTYNVGAELEFFYLRNADNPEFLDRSGYFDQLSHQPATDLRRDSVLYLEDMNIVTKYSHHEAAQSQHEIDLAYDDALITADNIITAKLVIKELAQMRGVYASFMPKPFSGVNGSGLHTHQSLYRDSKNMFFDPDDEHYLSVIGKRFISGLLYHAPEITLVTNQWINSYKRLVPGYEAPVFASWSHVNRSDLVRVPPYVKGRESSIRVEYRAPDPACNPYLAFAVMLAAGIKGIEEEYPIKSPVVGSVYDMSSQRRQAQNIMQLPASLGEAIRLAQNSDLLLDALGDHTLRSLIRNKEIEWEEYRSMVTDYEITRYLPIL